MDCTIVTSFASIISELAVDAVVAVVGVEGAVFLSGFPKVEENVVYAVVAGVVVLYLLWKAV